MYSLSAAFVVGRVATILPGVEIFMEIAIRDSFRIFPEQNKALPFAELPRDVLKTLRRSPAIGSERAAFLVCMDRRDSTIEEVVKSLHRERPHAQIVVYADEAHDSGALALRCIGAGACDYLVQGQHSLDRIKHHLFHGIKGRPAYAKFSDKLELRGQANLGFVATPYHPAALNDYYEGILPALEESGIKALLSREQVTPESILEKVRKQIDASCLAVVNLSTYHLAYDSPNVYFELGYALGKCPVILILRERDKAIVPANLAGAQYISYCCYSDLAMQLHWGLK